jgi:type VI secretion system secreted protein Hcp
MNRVTRIVSCVLAVAGLVVSASASAASYSFLMSAEGAKTGKFKGESNAKGEAGKIPAVAFSYSVRSPRDAATGAASGKRQHSPVTITKAWGASTPQFFNALVTNETLKSVLFEFTKASADGTTAVYETVKLTNAQVTGFTHRSGAVASGSPELDDISFTFQSIEIADLTGRTTAQDNWSN